MMERAGVCTKCNSQRVIELAVVPDAGNWGGSDSGCVTSCSGDSHVYRAILVTEDNRITGDTEAYACAGPRLVRGVHCDLRTIPWNEIEGIRAMLSPPYR
jgi:hypothetical protein